MDPYLERHWGDVHHRLIQYACDQLQVQLPEELCARVEERVFLETDMGSRRSIVPDLRIVQQRKRDEGTEAASNSGDTGGIAVAEPLRLILPNEPLTEGFIEIRDTATGNRVVTVIEILSPANKTGGNGTEEYLRKQQEILSGATSLVEIDLLRRGRRVTTIPRELLPDSHLTPYHATVRRGWLRNEFEYYRIPLRERLPVILTPLRETDKDVRLDLQLIVDQLYRLGRYGNLDYSREADPPLQGEDARWAEELLRGQGLR